MSSPWFFGPNGIKLSCAAGFISIVDPFLNPDGTPWSGSITYTLRYATTAAGATIVNAEQQFSVTSGINICLAPGLYTVVLQQSGVSYGITTQWGVPASGGPYTVAEIQGAVTLQAPGGLSVSTTKLTNAQVLALDGAPQTLVPAAPGIVNVPVFITAEMTGSPTYSSGDETLVVKLGTTTVFDWTVLGPPSVPTYFVTGWINPNGPINGNVTAYENQPVTVSADQAVTGSGTGIAFTTYYLAVPVL